MITHTRTASLRQDPSNACKQPDERQFEPLHLEENILLVLVYASKYATKYKVHGVKQVLGRTSRGVAGATTAAADLSPEGMLFGSCG